MAKKIFKYLTFVVASMLTGLVAHQIKLDDFSIENGLQMLHADSPYTTTTDNTTTNTGGWGGGNGGGDAGDGGGVNLINY